MVVVEVLLRVLSIERELLREVVEDASEDEEVVVPLGRHLRQPCHEREQRPQPEEGTWAAEEGLGQQTLQALQGARLSAL